MELLETGRAASRLRLRRAIWASNSYDQHGLKGAAGAAQALPVLLQGWRRQAQELVLRASSVSTFPRRSVVVFPIVWKLRAILSPAGQLQVLKFHPVLQVPGDAISLKSPLLNPLVHCATP